MAKCVAVMGPAAVGKSTLVDRLCGLEGRAPKSAAPGEPRIACFTHMGEEWAAVDCPGSLEFVQDSADALLGADVALIVVGPDPEQAALAAPFLKLAEDAGAPAIVFVNRIDEAQARLRDIAEALQVYSKHPLVLRQVPIREDGHVVGSVDLVSERAWRYQPGEPSKLVEIPSETRAREQEARSELLEGLSDFDDSLLEALIEDRALDREPVFDVCAATLRSGAVTPLFFGAAEPGAGVRRLMKALRHETPDVSATRRRLAGEDGDALLGAAVLAQHRKHIGKTVTLRLFDGGLKTAAQLGGGALGPLTDPASEKASALEQASAGAMAAAVKSDHLQRGRLYAGAGALPEPGWRRPPAPVWTRVLSPANARDEVKLSETLAQIAEDDPAVSVVHDPETGALVVSCQGALHLRRVRETLSSVFGVETVEDLAESPHRETISKSHSHAYRHKKQSGGAGQFADVAMTVAPNERGGGFVFAETVKGGAVPRQYMSAVEAGARDALSAGPLGFPVVDVTVTLTDGKAHSVDSSDLAFRIAARACVSEALALAEPVLLEPIHKVRFMAPQVFTGSLSPMVSSRRGQVLGFEEAGAPGWEAMSALLPEESLGDLISELRAATQGVGRYEAMFDHYQELRGRTASSVVAKRAEAREAERGGGRRAQRAMAG